MIIWGIYSGGGRRGEPIRWKAAKGRRGVGGLDILLRQCF